jgi:hypothetical protein
MSEASTPSSSPDSSMLFTDWLAIQVKYIAALVERAEAAAAKAEAAARGAEAPEQA